MAQIYDALITPVGNAGYAVSQGWLPRRSPYHRQLNLGGEQYNLQAYGADQVDVPAGGVYSTIRASIKYN